MTGYMAKVRDLAVTRMKTRPHMPISDKPKSVSMGSRPPTRSTQAPKGMRKSEPVS